MNQTIESNGIQYFDEDYFDFVLNYHGIIGSTYSYNGFEDLKHLYTLNKMFSNKPWGNIIDRSNSTKYPFKLQK